MDSFRSDYEYRMAQRLEEMVQQRDELISLNKDLENKLSLVGLTADELKGVHNLIEGQINLIMNLQDKGDVSNSTSAINSLCKLASLVSKPTD